MNANEETPYLRVGTAILKRARMPLSNGRCIETLIPWNVETLRQDYGKDYLARIPKYDGFCTIPSHTDYRREIHGFLNRYEPISTVPPFTPDPSCGTASAGMARHESTTMNVMKKMDVGRRITSSFSPTSSACAEA